MRGGWEVGGAKGSERKGGRRGGRHTGNPGLTRLELRLLFRLLVSCTRGSRSPVAPCRELTCFGEP